MRYQRYILTLGIGFLLSVQGVSAASIWHVQGEREFYLFGTIHVLKPDTYPLPDIYQQTFAQCDALWLEADLGELEQPQAAAEARSLMTLPPGVKMTDQLSAEGLAAVEQLAAEAQIPLAALQSLKPWAAVNALTVVIFQQHGFDVEHGLDTYLQQQAQTRNLPIRNFETIVWQLSMFDQLATDSGDQFIRFSANGIEKVEEMVNNLYQSWQTGDLTALYEQAEFDGYPQIEQVMLTQRNNTWMQTLLNLEDSDTHCVAVGALHMAAENGLVAQFEQAGYRVRRLD